MELKGHTIGFKGEYSATVLKADGTVKEFLNEEKTLRSGDVIKNLLLDNFFQRLSLPNPFLDVNSFEVISIRCGTGSSAVAANQISLANQLPITGSWPSATFVNTGSFAVVEGKLRKVESYTFTFSLGRVVGNISELGVNFSNVTTASNTLVHSRALVVDGNGNPTTITVTAQEQLILTYSLICERQIEDSVHETTLLLNGVPSTIEVTVRTLNDISINNLVSSGYNSSSSKPFRVFNGALGAQNQPPSGSSLTYQPALSSLNHEAVVNGKRWTYSFSISAGNLTGGISAIIPNFAGTSAVGFKFGFNPPIPKNSDRTLSITFEQTFGRLP